MPLSWNEIRSRAHAFSREWGEAQSESADAKLFWNAFFHVFGVSVRRVASFEKRVHSHAGAGFIDLLWKGKLLVEHKSRGKNLDHAYRQALDYFPGLKESDLPRYVLVCDFARFRLHDLEEDARFDFAIEELHKHVNRFAFIAGYQTQKLREQDAVNIEAAESMGKLHDALRAGGYGGHELEVYLVRLLFCLFADNTGIFRDRQFQFYIEDRTAEDGSDLGPRLDTLFYVLNTPREKRLAHQDEQVAEFAHINGKLFAERLRPAAFTRAMRKLLLQCCELDWSRISPAIFGSLFQSIMDADARRNLGAHYTSEKNILKLINPLFMDELRAEFARVKRNPNALFQFQKKLAALKFLDPACGCGNFLVIAYRELRMLELEVLRATHAEGKQAPDIDHLLQLNVDQFYGIELEEFPAQIAQVAMWLVDHQMNVRASAEFGAYFARIPLTTAANIVHGNALRMEWDDVAPGVDFVMGNPPFIGKNFQNAEQKKDLARVFGGVKHGSLDYVTAWYQCALRYAKSNGGETRCAFVSSNSITQGEQVALLWPSLLEEGIRVHFAHRTFQWTNEARGKAAVHCVIIGFGLQDAPKKVLFDYEHVKGEPHEIACAHINPYLVDAADVVVTAMRKPLSDCPPMVNGSKPADGGNLLLSESEKDALLKAEPAAAAWVKPFSSANEFINGIARFCLWLKDCPPQVLRKLPLVMQRVQAVQAMRAKSADKNTQQFAAKPTVFMADRQPATAYLAVPRVSSERRVYVPIGYLPPDHIAGDAMQTVPNATPFHFGVITSAMHMAWMRTVSGRLKSDYRYSASGVYNNFIWPENPTAAQTHAIESAAQTILDTRATFPGATLADLYDPATMPPALLDAHQKLDRATDRAYRPQPFPNESARVAFLFELYRRHTAPVMPAAGEKRGRKKAEK